MAQVIRGQRPLPTINGGSAAGFFRLKPHTPRPGYLSACPVGRGLERFSFPQLITLHPGIAMRTRAYWCPELETLSVNTVLHAKPEWRGLRDATAAWRATRLLAEPFAREILAPCAGHAWCLSVETILDAVSCLTIAARGRVRLL
jgi:hypothetical protein